MAPMVSGIDKKKDELKNLNESLLNEKNKLLQIRKYIENNFEYVEKNFSNKVREIYYDKRSKKTIYGSTTSEERRELAEEGIELLEVPWIEKDN